MNHPNMNHLTRACAAVLLFFGLASPLLAQPVAAPAQALPGKPLLPGEAQARARSMANRVGYLRALDFEDAEEVAEALEQANALLQPTPAQERALKAFATIAEGDIFTPGQRLVFQLDWQEARQEWQAQFDEALRQLAARLDLAHKPRLRAAILFLLPAWPFSQQIAGPELGDAIAPAAPNPQAPDLATALSRALQDTPEFYDLRRRHYIRDTITGKLSRAGYDQKIINAAFAFRRELETARDSREDVSFVLWQTLNDKNASESMLSGVLAAYEGVDQKARERVQVAAKELASVTGSADDPRLSAIFLSLGMGDDVPNLPNISDRLSGQFWIEQLRARMKQSPAPK